MSNAEESTYSSSKARQARKKLRINDLVEVYLYKKEDESKDDDLHEPPLKRMKLSDGFSNEFRTQLKTDEEVE